VRESCSGVQNEGRGHRILIINPQGSGGRQYKEVHVAQIALWLLQVVFALYLNGRDHLYGTNISICVSIIRLNSIDETMSNPE
jgi:hypothetical protein